MEHTFQPWLNCLKKNMRLSNLITQPHNANTLIYLPSLPRPTVEGFQLDPIKATTLPVTGLGLAMLIQLVILPFGISQARTGKP